MAATPGINSLPAMGRHAQVTSAIRAAASATGVDFAYLMGQARIESGLNPAARARTSSATGLYQFIDQSWLGVVHRHGANHGLGWAADAIRRAPGGRWQVADPAARAAILNLRTDPAIAARMAAEHAADNRTYLEARTGRAAEPVDLYLAHFLGPAGAARFLNAHSGEPNASAAALFPRAAAANRNIFYERNGAPRTLDAVRQRFAERLGTEAPALSDRTAETEPALPQKQVQPADWLRISRSADGARTSMGMGIDIDPSRARLAYLLLSAPGV